VGSGALGFRGVVELLAADFQAEDTGPGAGRGQPKAGLVEEAAAVPIRALLDVLDGLVDALGQLSAQESKDRAKTDKSCRDRPNQRTPGTRRPHGMAGSRHETAITAKSSTSPTFGEEQYEPDLLEYGSQHYQDLTSEWRKERDRKRKKKKKKKRKA